MKTIEQFTREHIFLEMNNIIENLFKHEIISCDDIENLYDVDTEEAKEIFQWFSIDDDMADFLRFRKEPVLQVCNRFFWGRTCYGQSIVDDQVIQDIYKHVMGR